MYFKIVCKLLLTVFQVALLHYLNSQIQFTKGNKTEEKEAIKNLLFSFLIFISIFSSMSVLAKYSVNFPDKISNTLFLICLIAILGLWGVQNKDLLLKNVKQLHWFPFVKQEVEIVKESMSNQGDSVLQNVYPFVSHYGKPAPKDLTKTNDVSFNEKRTPLMVLEYK
jgi:hypothetical protein